MFEKLREILKQLDRSIFEGERYERNMRGITLVAVFIVVLNAITGPLNLMNGYIGVFVASTLFGIAGLVMLFFARFKRNRTGAVVTAFISVIALFTYEILTVSHGFPIFWTLLLPLAFCYLADVKTGICLSLYFLVLFLVLFYTPLRDIVAVQYSDVIAQRFPILYFADVALTTYIMVQYHLTTLRQMDNAKQLLEAKEAADRANAAKSEFLANMSHEIRTPINAVLGMNEMIIRESAQMRDLPVGDTQALQSSLENIDSYAGDVQSAGRHLLSIINGILDFSRLEAGKMDIVEAPYSLCSLLHDVYRMAFFKAQEKGLEFALDVDEALPDNLYGDKARLRQVISNILTNALKYTAQGSVSMTVRGSMDDGNEPGRTIQLAIEARDTGIGIKPEDIKRLFEQFQRVDLDRNSTIEGTGLGLAIAQDLLKAMGGSIQVESEYGVGSAFTVIVPQKIVSCEPVGDFRLQVKRDASATEAYREAFRAPDARILVVDDTRMNLTVAEGLLKSTGVQVDTATSGMRAIELAGETVYDLILMDQRMPEMDGTEAMRHIRRQADGPNSQTPIVCLTADAIIGAKERYLEEGFTDYLSKPIESQALEQMLIRHLPEAKVAFAPQGSREADAEKAQDGAYVPEGYSALREADIDPAVGLRYCQGDEGLYKTLLAEYAYGADGKARDMEACRAAQDWDGLSILVHALKSTSRTIGASKLSEAAARMEQAADSADEKAVDGGFTQLLALYEETAAAICLLDLPEEEPSSEDDEIMEFFPE